MTKTTHLTDDDAIRPHPQCVAEQVALRYFAAALDVGHARLEAHDMLALELKLGRILDRDQALVLGNPFRQHIEQRALARAGAA